MNSPADVERNTYIMKAIEKHSERMQKVQNFRPARIISVSFIPKEDRETGYYMNDVGIAQEIFRDENPRLVGLLESDDAIHIKWVTSNNGLCECYAKLPASTNPSKQNYSRKNLEAVWNFVAYEIADFYNHTTIK